MNYTCMILSMAKFPKGDAGSARVFTFAKMLESSNITTLVVGFGESTLFKTTEYAGIQYTSMRSPSKFNRVLDYISYYRRLYTYILSKNSLKYIIISHHIPLYAFILLKRFAIKREISFIYDCVESFSSKQFLFGILSPTYIINKYINNIIVDNKTKVIAISEYLATKFSSKHIQCITIPAIQYFHTNNHLKTDVSTNLMYAGQPGKKDILDLIFKALIHLKNNNQLNITFHLYGISQVDAIEGKITTKDELLFLGEDVVFHGRVPSEVVKEAYQKIDYTILLRDPTLEHAKAGFPTKVAESLSHGVPVITNITSDLSKYLFDGYNALIIDNLNINEIARQLLNCQSKIGVTVMKNNAYITSMKFLSTVNFEHIFMKFVTGELA